MRWQPVQWQAMVRIGGLEIFRRTRPQRHAPSLGSFSLLVMVILPSSFQCLARRQAPWEVAPDQNAQARTARKIIGERHRPAKADPQTRCGADLKGNTRTPAHGLRDERRVD